MTLILAVLASLVVVASSTFYDARSALPTYSPGTVNATWDGKCAYAKPIANFDPAQYVGPSPSGSSRAAWYQLAAQDQIFEIGCTCVVAEYGSFPNGTVTVENTCTRFGSTSSIKGKAVPAPAKYGQGTFVVSFPSFPSSTTCPGPNYIVNKAWTSKPGEPKKFEAGKPLETVIVGSYNFQGWFLLSRTRNVARSLIDDYLKEVASAGYDLKTQYSITPQNNCSAVKN